METSTALDVLRHCPFSIYLCVLACLHYTQTYVETQYRFPGDYAPLTDISKTFGHGHLYLVCTEVTSKAIVGTLLLSAYPLQRKLHTVEFVSLSNSR